MTVAELLARISSRELTEWQIHYGDDPFGEERADLRSAIIASVIAEVNRDRKKRAKPFQADDFMPKFGGEQEEQGQTVNDQLHIVEMLNIAFGGKDLRDK